MWVESFILLQIYIWPLQQKNEFNASVSLVIQLYQQIAIKSYFKNLLEMKSSKFFGVIKCSCLSRGSRFYTQDRFKFIRVVLPAQKRWHFILKWFRFDSLFVLLTQTCEKSNIIQVSRLFLKMFKSLEIYIKNCIIYWKISKNYAKVKNKMT